MRRRALAVIGGLAVCQISMIVCLALAVGLLAALQAWPIVALAAVGALLLLPGLAGGGLAGFLADHHGGVYGTVTALLFGGSILLVKLVVAPTFGFLLMPYDTILYSALIGALGLSGAIGGILAHRRRRLGPPARRAQAALRQPAA